ncbi:hypothetical protein [Yersinia pseudotuberculosis]|nr:hypothetical protein [Yersinia pseudotuberculosis]
MGKLITDVAGLLSGGAGGLLKVVWYSLKRLWLRFDYLRLILKRRY